MKAHRKWVAYKPIYYWLGATFLLFFVNYHQWDLWVLIPVTQFWLIWHWRICIQHWHLLIRLWLNSKKFWCDIVCPWHTIFTSAVIILGVAWVFSWLSVLKYRNYIGSKLLDPDACIHSRLASVIYLWVIALSYQCH